MFRLCPLLIFVVAIYFAVMLAFTPGVLMVDLIWFKMFSGSDFSITTGDALVVLGLILLYFEILKSTQSSNKVIIEHVISLMVFIGCLLAFLTLSAAGSATFFLITVMTLLDVIAGFTVTVVAARRDFSVGE